MTHNFTYSDKIDFKIPKNCRKVSKRSLWKHYFSRLAFSFLKSDLIFGIRVGPTHSVQQCHSHLVMCVSLSIDLMRCGFGELECIWKFVPAFQFTDSQLTVLIKWKKPAKNLKLIRVPHSLQSFQIKMISFIFVYFVCSITLNFITLLSSHYL